MYFAIDRFPSYGKLSRLDTREVRAGARVAQDDYSKENAQDFALWKSAKPEDEAAGAAWDSPWGRGRPGWHLECSAMAIDLLGETLDIHCGGIDLIFPHHEDEIAQSEAATGQTFSRFWCHGAFLLTEGTKMAKRLGNVTTVRGMREADISAGGGAAFRVQHALPEGAQPVGGGARGVDQRGAAGGRLSPSGWRRRGAARRSWRRRRRRLWRRWRRRCSTT